MIEHCESNGSPPDTWWLRYLDVLAVLALAVIPALIYALISFLTSAKSSESFNLNLFTLIVRSFQVSLPIIAIMHLRKINWGDHGFVQFRPAYDLIMGGILMVASLAMFYLLAYAWSLATYPGTATESVDPLPVGPAYSVSVLLMIILASLANGFAEELAMRSYLIPRLQEITKSPAIAILATSFLFGSYHIYQGFLAVIYSFLVGIILGLYFHRKRRFWPVFVAHFFLDAIPMAQSLSYAG